VQRSRGRRWTRRRQRMQLGCRPRPPGVRPGPLQRDFGWHAHAGNFLGRCSLPARPAGNRPRDYHYTTCPAVIVMGRGGVQPSAAPKDATQSVRTAGSMEQGGARVMVRRRARGQRHPQHALRSRAPARPGRQPIRTSVRHTSATAPALEALPRGRQPGRLEPARPRRRCGADARQLSAARMASRSHHRGRHLQQPRAPTAADELLQEGAPRAAREASGTTPAAGPRRQARGQAQMRVPSAPQAQVLSTTGHRSPASSCRGDRAVVIHSDH
jgi:hypothetical protein